MGRRPATSNHAGASAGGQAAPDAARGSISSGRRRAWPRVRGISIFREKNRRYIGKSQSKRPPNGTQRTPHQFTASLPSARRRRAVPVSHAHTAASITGPRNNHNRHSKESCESTGPRRTTHCPPRGADMPQGHGMLPACAGCHTYPPELKGIGMMARLECGCVARQSTALAILACIPSR
jgi:hypothetical protein